MVDINGSYESIEISGRGITYVRMGMLTRLRQWALRKLGGVDREATAKFAAAFLQPNGKAARTVTHDGLEIAGETFICLDGGTVGIAVAPWVRSCTIRDCTFVDSEPSAIRITSAPPYSPPATKRSNT